MPVALPCLCLDGSIRDLVRAGVWVGEGWVAELELAGNPADTLSPVAEGVLALAGLTLRELGSVAVNLGPGSILGIRAAAVSAKAWSASLGLGAHGWSGHRAAALAAAGTCDGVVSEGREGRWVVQRLEGDTPVGRVVEQDPAELASLHLRPLRGGFRREIPPGLGEPVDAWPSLPGIFVMRGLPGLTDDLDALNAPGSYALWSGNPRAKPAP